jgi:hypothetical protein
MEYQKDIIMTDRLGVIGTDFKEEYLAHLFCLGGTCSYRFNERDFELLELRLADTGHRFYRETLINAMQAAILDFFDFHASLYGESDISTQKASIMNRFLNMLESGTYREHREVTYYADCLCVTSKYLSEVSKKVSGYAANYWINRYTILDITRLLRDKSLIFVQISDMFGFSSPAYFSRYVQQNLGIRPSDYRD